MVDIDRPISFSDVLGPAAGFLSRTKSFRRRRLVLRRVGNPSYFVILVGKANERLTAGVMGGRLSVCSHDRIGPLGFFVSCLVRDRPLLLLLPASPLHPRSGP